MPEQVVIISARGEDSFLPEQVSRIKSVSEVTFYSRLDPLTDDELVSLIKDAGIAALTRRSVKHLSSETLARLPGLNGLAIYSTGYDWVDHYFLSQRGITLSYLKNYSTVSVVEHIMGLMICMSRRIHLSCDKVRGLVPSNVSLCGWELSGKKLGIVGLGNIGQGLARRAIAFGMEVYYFDKDYKNIEGANYLVLDDLLQNCDVISL